ncbi:facilitated trehalose transporter Tret1-2 homolog isoform X2 [Diorhabda carinulata]|nr:facilitated trehalose transporter Tret1-2 homolog isoform X2 [Diorhabda carinulata]
MVDHNTNNEKDENVKFDFNRDIISDQDSSQKKPDTWYLYFVIATGLITWIVGGGRVVWSSSALVKFNSTDPAINPLGRPITTGETSLLVGLPGIISLPSSFLFTQLSDLVGRKYCLQIIGILSFFGYIGLAFSSSVPIIITFLTILSYVLGGIMCVFPIYLTEICEDHNRAKYGCLLAACFFLGQLYTNAIGPLFHIRYYTLLVAAPLLFFLIFFNFAPETPVYLCTKGKKEECMKALKKLRGNKSGSELEKDFTSIIQNVPSLKSGKKPNMSQLFFTKEGRFGLLLSSLAMLFQLMSGGSVLVPLMAPIFNQFKSVVNGEIVAVSISTLKVISLFTTVFIIERIGRRPLLIISSIGSGIPMAILGTFLYFQYIGSSIINEIEWLPFVAILIYYVMFGIGLSPIPIPMISVLSPIELQSASNTLVFTVTNFLLAVFQAVYPLISEKFGPQWCMWIFALSCFIGAVVFYWLLPETKGKSYEEIQQILRNHRYLKV